MTRPPREAAQRTPGCRSIFQAPAGSTFDPTNSIIGNRNLIRVAVAWDHTHVLPLWGTFIGKASSFLGMDVSVSVTEETPRRVKAEPVGKGISDATNI